jgi:hypothetical protein
MKTAFAVSAALLLAGTAYVLPVHAQTAPQTQWGAPQTQSQSYRSGAHTVPYAPTQAQPWSAGQTQSGTTASSQMQSHGVTGNEMATEGQAPQGSYHTSCKDVRMANDTLIAFCSNPDGTWQTSAIGPVSQCTGDIQNINGQLTCNETGVGSSTPPSRAYPSQTQPKY